MIISLETNEYVRKFLYSFITICFIYFFYKISRYPDKNYGLLMILILIGSLFGSAVLKLISLCTEGGPLLMGFVRIFNNFANSWIICLAIYHYSILKSLKGKFREFPFKSFLIYGVVICAIIAFFTAQEFITKWNGDSYLIDIVSSLILVYIIVEVKKLQDEIQFGPYTTQGSSSKLIRFASIEACFMTLDGILAFLISKSPCFDSDLHNAETGYCVLLDLLGLVLYQCWIWYAIFFNWKMLTLMERDGTQNELLNNRVSTPFSEYSDV